jgi:hypothetical protein
MKSQIIHESISQFPAKNAALGDTSFWVLTFAASGLSVYFGAEVYPLEIFLLVIALTQAWRGLEHVPAWVLNSLLTWLAIGLVSDITAGASSFEVLKGSLRIGFLLSDILGIYAITQLRRNRLIPLLGGYAVSYIVSLVLQPSNMAKLDSWKFGLSIPTCIFVLMLLEAKISSRGLRLFALLVLISLNVIFDFRSLAVVLLALTIFTFASENKPSMGRRIGFGIVSSACLIAAVVVTLLSTNLASSGLLGESAKIKSSFQNEGSLGAFASSRTEVLFQIDTIVRHPLTGIGSYSTAESSAYEYASTTLDKLGYSVLAQQVLSEQSPFHSQLLGSIAQNGVFAGAFWILWIAFLVRYLKKWYDHKISRSLLGPFLALLALWNTFFSPFGSTSRMLVAITLIYLLSQRKDDHVENFNSHSQF